MAPSELIEGFPAPLYRTEVSGIPTFWSEADEPFSATLSFRVGRADETLLTTGLTHVVEHLAMPRHDRHLFEVNARVEPFRTIFWAHGQRDEVLAFLRSTAAALASLPLERVDFERRILKVESDGFESTSYSTLLCSRFGARGPGLYDYSELGLYRVTAEDVAAWAEKHFTAANAALWLTGPPPEGFELALRAGTAPDPPTLPDAICDPPLFINWGRRGIAFSTLARRTVAAVVASRLIRQRIHHELRYDHGISYATQLEYEPVDADVAHVFLSADAAVTHEELARDTVITALEQLAEHGPTEEELEYERRLSERIGNDPREARSHLDMLATDHLLGADRVTSTEAIEAVAALSPADVGNVVTELLGTMALCIPDGLDCPSERFSPLPPWDDPEVPGRRYSGPRRIPLVGGSQEIVVGADGVSWKDRAGTATIRFEDAAALVCDGATPVVLHRLDGRWLNFRDPATWRSGERLLADIMSATPPELVVDFSD